MSIVRWSPERELIPRDLMNFRREVNRMFDGLFRSAWDDEDSMTPAMWSPAVDLAERDDEYLVKVELPGMSKNDVKITMQNNVLTIKGEKKQEKETREANFHRLERAYGSFQRSLVLPTDVKGEKIDATFRDGVLTVTLPKAEEAKPRQIDVAVK